MDAFSLGANDMAEAVINDFLHYGKPPLTFDDYRAELAKAGVPNFAKVIEPFEVLVNQDPA